MKQLYINFTLAIIGCAALLITSFVWNFIYGKHHIFELARHEAVAHLQKAQALSHWTSNHGRVYVAPDKNTPPNHIPDRDVAMPNEKQLTLMNHSYLFKLLLNDNDNLTGIRTRITGLRFLNPDNAPDQWERQGLLQFEEGRDEVFERSDIDEKPYMRVMRPMKADKSCLKCHVGQGVQVGQTLGAVSVAMPMDIFIESEKNMLSHIMLTHGLVLSIQCLVILVVFFKRKRRLMERLKTEQALQESEQKVKLLINSTAEAIYGIDFDGKCTFCNPASLKLLGYYSQKDLLGKKIHDLIHFQNLDGAPIPIEDCKIHKASEMKNYIHADNEFFWRADGQPFPVEYWCHPIKKDGVVIGSVVTFLDITERKQMEFELKRELAIHSALSEIAEALLVPCSDITTITVFILNQSMKLTTSKHGYVAEIDPVNDDLVGHTLTQMFGNQCNMSAVWQKVRFPKSAHGYNGLWGHALNTGNSFYTNSPETHPSYKGCEPKGHLPLKRFLSVPAVIDGKLIGQIALANSLRDYTQLDIETITRFANLYAIALHRMRGEIELRAHRDHLEDLVKERTNKLSAANELLRGQIVKRKQVEEELRKSREMVQSIIDNAPMVVYLKDKQGRHIMINKHFENLFRLNASEVIGKFDHELFPESMANVFSQSDQAILDSKAPLSQEDTITQSDGVVLTYLTTKFPIFDAYGNPYRVCGIATNITERKAMEEQIKRSLREKELLLSEIHHRVKNNLAIVSSIIQMKQHYIHDENLQKLFKETEDRIKSMALIHEKLYRSEDLTNIDFRDYIDSLTLSLFNSYRILSNRVTLTLDVKNVSFGIDIAVPCGLLLNELLTNSLKYAFPNGKGGQIAISMYPIDDEIELVVKDNGIGLPKGFDMRNTESLGFQLIVGIVESQLEGGIELSNDNGAEVKVRFKMPKTI